MQVVMIGRLRSASCGARQVSGTSWSCGLLSPAERTLLAQLAVFVGGFSLAAAEAICTLPADESVVAMDKNATLAHSAIAAGVNALLTHSLLVRRGAEVADRYSMLHCCRRCSLRTLQETAEVEARFSMLEIIREFALEQLRARWRLRLGWPARLGLSGSVMGAMPKVGGGWSR